MYGNVIPFILQTQYYHLQLNDDLLTYLFTYTGGYTITDLLIIIKNLYIETQKSRILFALFISEQIPLQCPIFIHYFILLFPLNSNSLIFKVCSQLSIYSARINHELQRYWRIHKYQGTALQIYLLEYGEERRIGCIFYSLFRIEQKLHIRMPTGILLYGPSGCGKTLFANCIAGERNINVINIQVPYFLSRLLVQSTVLFSKYFGETERNIRQLFSIARSACPCLIILDEIDILASKRSYENSTNELNDRIVGTLLNELDGIDVYLFFLSDSLDEFCDCDWMHQSISLSG